MMRKFLLSAALLGFCVLGYLNYHNPASQPEPVTPVAEPAPARVSEAQAPVRPVRSFQAREVPSQSDSLPPYAKKPEGNVIEFKLVDGMAVAYGDVVLGKPQGDFRGDRGMTEISQPQLWQKPEIPYLINPSLPNPQRVEKALDYFRLHTPVRFVPYQGQHDGIVFEPGNEHCYSALGKIGGLQPIKLSAGCQPQEIMHEIMHTLGFVHEQSRADRDRYVQILWQNIEPKYQDQFAMVPDALLEAERDSGFDYHSIMLYEPNAFAVRPELATLRSTGSEPIAPAREALSDEDLKRINRLYGLYGESP